MKTRAYLLFACLMLIGLLITAGPVSAWPDTMPHHDSDSGSDVNAIGVCTTHMPDPKSLGSNPWFKLCKASSGATKWSHEIRGDVFPYTLVSTQCSFSQVAISTSKFNCSVPDSGDYRSTIKYWVGNSMYAGHADRTFHK